MANRTTIKSVKDALVVGSEIIESAKSEVVWIVPPPMLVLAIQYGLLEKTKMLIQRGGQVRGISDFSYLYVDVIRENLAIGANVRHFRQYQGVFMLVGDERQSIYSINLDAESLSLATSIVALWSDDPVYAEYLSSTFETAWEQSIPAAQRIEELLKQGPPQV